MRKLSVGIALIGESKMLFLDEPSAAVDAAAKRHLWKVIKARGVDQQLGDLGPVVEEVCHKAEDRGADDALHGRSRSLEQPHGHPSHGAAPVSGHANAHQAQVRHGLLGFVA